MTQLTGTFGRGDITRHRASDGLYEVESLGRLEDTKEVRYAYRSLADGQVWYRKQELMEDGRFDLVRKALPLPAGWNLFVEAALQAKAWKLDADGQLMAQTSGADFTATGLTLAILIDTIQGMGVLVPAQTSTTVSPPPATHVLVKDGVIGEGDLVWDDGDQRWVAAHEDWFGDEVASYYGVARLQR